MAVNYEDERFQNVKAEESAALNNVNNMYNNMINESNQFYQDQINAAQEYGEKQAEIQQANTDFTIEKIEQQKDQLNRDYTKEQKGAYVDWQKQSNVYGAEAEKLAAAGLLNSGYSESSQVAMYTAYQNRVAQARDTYNRAVLDYDNGIKEAQLANNAALAEIAYKSLQTKLELALGGFQYKNALLQQQMAAQNEVGDRYYSRWRDVLSQINTENVLEEQKRQFNASLSASSRSGGSGSSGNSYTINSGNSGGSGSGLGALVKGAADAVTGAAKNAVKTASNTNGYTKTNDFVQLPSGDYIPLYKKNGGLYYNDGSGWKVWSEPRQSQQLLTIDPIFHKGTGFGGGGSGGSGF